MQTGTVTHVIVRNFTVRAWMGSFFFFFTDWSSYVHMRTVSCCESDGQNCEGMSAGFDSKTQMWWYYAGARGSWTAVTLKTDVPVLSSSVKQSKKVGWIRYPKMLLTASQHWVTSEKSKGLSYAVVEAQNLAWVIRVRKWTEELFFSPLYLLTVMNN
jgi:hypothetical protein